ncbi:hypothetical protein C5167_009810 [Papaver somniferum]|uniref:Uncharacterized protein n=1 Tax=Papaver somniferum TaxID=3469 RepID=A0A4Y7K1B0_PAPSO|nr:hypothetical protein C5167_009810 [Papaver somniferum]
MLMKDCYLVSILSEMSVNMAMDIKRSEVVASVSHAFVNSGQGNNKKDPKSSCFGWTRSQRYLIDN